MRVHNIITISEDKYFIITDGHMTVIVDYSETNSHDNILTFQDYLLSDLKLKTVKSFTAIDKGIIKILI